MNCDSVIKRRLAKLTSLRSVFLVLGFSFKALDALGRFILGHCVTLGQRES
jgi:hypothetical protein